jgi:ADP-heptose:LPS heptosyltransferase
MLLWAPGAANDPGHPGDDDKAAKVLAACRNLPIYPAPTQTLPDLIAALALCDQVVCADGGAMHLAAGLGKPIVCLFGDSPADRWHPWGVTYELLQRSSVTEISAVETANSFGKLAP